MITGFNTNVRHGGRGFHVQTEDSGRNHPHVISHLYFEGTILASEKRDYTEMLESQDLTAQVRRLMDEQHRAMLDRLRGGEFDGVIAERLDGGDAPQPAAPEASESQPPASEPRAFGEGVVSPKPLDEVILDYLVEKARPRGSQAPARPARGRRAPE
jgi:hypothetical protein